ncbi:MAG: hypothetical protein BECKG1743D_GA0114223_113002, partial [Candidatus Kentron sp. G]
LSQAQDSSLTHSTLQLRATMSAIRHPCLIMGQCPSNFEGRNTCHFAQLGRCNNSYIGAVCKSHLALPNCVENVFKMLIYSI